jgi:NAD-dependent DNA ligase
VRTDWLHECFRSGERVNEAKFSVPYLAQLRVSITGYPPEEREDVKTKCEANGGVYTSHLDRDCTHLLALNTQGPKYDAAVKWGLKIVSKDWLDDHIKTRGISTSKS